MRLRRWIVNEYIRRELLRDRAIHAVDLLLVVDPVKLGYFPSGIAPRTAYYAIDAHLAVHQHVEDARVPEYDFVFVAQKDYLRQYVDAGCRSVRWLPLGFDPSVHRRMGLPKTRNVSFVGSPWPAKGRGEILQALQQSVGLETHTAFLHDMVRIFNESKIVFNKSSRGDVNMRVFEALGCGSFLLTDRCVNGQEELFTPKEHLVTYDSPEEAAELAKYYLGADAERQEIADQGYLHARAHHTYLHRTADILRQTLGYDPGEPKAAVR